MYYGTKANQLETSVESLLAQSYKPEKILLIQDGPVSSEVTTLLASLEANEKSVYLKRSEVNIGRGLARNCALNQIKTEFVALMDCDDIARTDRFRLQLECLKNSNFDIVGGVVEEFNIIPGDLGELRKLPSSHSDIKKLINFRTPYNNVTIMFRTSLFHELKGFRKLNYVEDWDFAVRAMAHGAVFHNLSEVLVDVRKNEKRNYNLIYLTEEIRLIWQAGRILNTQKIRVFASMTFRVCRFFLPLWVVSRIYSMFLRQNRNKKNKA